MSEYLQICESRSLKAKFKLKPDARNLIGRGESCAIRVKDPAASLEHCQVVNRDGLWVLKDLGSQSGTLIQDAQISETVLAEGDCFQIGKYEFVLVSEEPKSHERTHSLSGRHIGPFDLLESLGGCDSVQTYIARTAKKQKVRLRVWPRANVPKQAAQKLAASFRQAPRQPAVLSVLHVGNTERSFWIATPVVPGNSLRQRLDEHGKFSPRKAISTVRKVAETVATSHSAHGLLDPLNIFFLDNGRICLADTATTEQTRRSLQDIIRCGREPQSWAYTAPELISSDEPPSQACDVYSLGACLYELLAGSPPFRGSSENEVKDSVQNDPIRPLRELATESPKGLIELVDKCLSKNPKQRFQSLKELIEALKQLQSRLKASARQKPSDPATRPGPDQPSSSDSVELVTVPDPLGPKRQKPWLAVMLAGMFVFSVCVGALFYFFGNSGDDDDSTYTTQPHVINDPDPSEPSIADPPRTRSELLDSPDRLLVKPESGITELADAVELAQDGQVIEVATDVAPATPIELKGKSITLVAAPENRPRFEQPIRIKGGGTVRIEGFHFEPRNEFEPAIIIEQMPEKLELVYCSFRDTSDGALLLFQRPAEGTEARRELLITNCHLAGYTLLEFQDSLPATRIENNCFVASLAAFDWQLTAAADGQGRYGMLIRDNTFYCKSIFHVHAEDVEDQIPRLPSVAIRLDDNLFAFPVREKARFFHWEAWKRPDIPMDHFQFSGGTNVFTGLGEWYMATATALSDLAPIPQPILVAPEQWKDNWATEVTNPVATVADFVVRHTKLNVESVRPVEFALHPQSSLREQGRNQQPLGADVQTIAHPP